MEMERFKYITALILGTVAAFLETFFKTYGAVLCLVLCAVTLDVITGLIRARVTGVRWNSQAAQKGFWKKMALLAGLFFGVFLDAFIPLLLSVVTIELPVYLPFGMIVGCYIILNEAISICENLYECNPDIMPKWIKNLLTKAKDSIDKEADK